MAARTRFWIGRPNGFGSALVSATKRLELQVDDELEYAALEALARELGKEPFDRVEPGCRGRGEVEGAARMSRQPLPHLRMFVGRVIVDDCVDHFSRKDLRLDRIEEADELLVPMALHVAADDGAIEDVELRWTFPVAGPRRVSRTASARPGCACFSSKTGPAGR
jgi:hypothetical protein